MICRQPHPKPSIVTKASHDNTSSTLPDHGARRRMAKRVGLLTGLVALMTLGLWARGCAVPAGPRPNIIVIVVDTLRADHLGCYGYQRATSPNVDRFAADALLFERCLSHAPETRTSVAAIFSGFLPHETYVPALQRAPDGLEMLAEMLQSFGYQTLAVVSNYVLRRGYGFEQGFAVYDDKMDDFETIRPVPERIAEHTTDRAIELLEQHRDKPVFMWIHYQDPHGPYTPPPGYAAQFRDPDQPPRLLKLNDNWTGAGGIPDYQQRDDNRDYHDYVANYDGEIRYFDDHFKRLIDALKSLGMYDDSLIVLTADHGEGMGEQDYYFAHGEHLYASQTHVPLIMKYGETLKGRRSDFVQHADLVPTILRMLELDPNPAYPGRDLRQPMPAGRSIVSELHPGLPERPTQYSIVVDGLKLIHGVDSKRYEFYNLAVDPYETKDLSDNKTYAPRVVKLKKKLARRAGEDRLGLRVERREVVLTDEEKRKMRSLGYTQ